MSNVKETIDVDVPSDHPIKDELLFRAVSVAANQQPTLVDIALQIEFGIAQKSSSDPVMIDALGNVTFNQAGNYLAEMTVQFGRSGASGTSLLFGRILINGVAILNSPAVKLPNADSLSVIQFNIPVLNIPATAILTFEIIRDSTGNNSGGLFQNTPIASGWNPSPTAILNIYRTVTE